jgi:hypothetical protein
MNFDMLSKLKQGFFKYDVKDYYAILGVPLDASAKEIRLRYLKIAYQLHPDTCQSETQEHKQKASELLSKLVNPAYENLYKDKLRRECELIFSAMGRKLADDSAKITLASESAKKLYREEENRDELYHQLIEQLAAAQYEDFQLITQKIALISELNMVYLMLQKAAELQISIDNKPKAAVRAREPRTSEPIVTQAPNPTVEETPAETKKESVSSTTSRVSKLIDSARGHLENKNWEQGILDIREALKIEPNNSTCHALIGSLYRKQGNDAMAKVHLKKAMQLNPQEPELDPRDRIVQEIRKELNGQGKTKGRKTSSNKDKKPLDKSQAQKEKKGPPKIFGIPLW